MIWGLHFASGGQTKCTMQNFEVLLEEPSPQVLELKLTGELDLGTVDTLRAAAGPAAASGAYRCLILDMTELGFIDSSGLHVLTEVDKAMASAAGAMKLVCRPGCITKVLELTGLDRVFTIVTEPAETAVGVAS